MTKSKLMNPVNVKKYPRLKFYVPQKTFLEKKNF